MPTIVVADGQSFPDENYNSLRAVCEKRGYTFRVERCETGDDLPRYCADADAILLVYPNVTEEVLQKLPVCRVIVRFGIGVDMLDLEACTRHGVAACNVPDYGICEVATHAISLLLALQRKLVLYNNSVRKGEWLDTVGYEMRRLSTRTLGFVGFGNIARQAAEYARAFGYTTIAYDPFLPAEMFDGNKTEQVALDDLYARADAISIHAPLTPQSKYLINDAAIGKMKQGVFIVNTARGPLVETAALLRGLQSGKVAGAGLDVVAEEPIRDPNFSLLSQENVIITPHCGYRSLEAFTTLKERTAEIACRFLSGDIPPYVVNKDVLDKLKQ